MKLFEYAGISLLFLLFVNSAFSVNKPMVFSTWEGFEVDKCASIWVIKKFIDKNAVIKFISKGKKIDKGIPFDTPDAKLRRYHNMSTFETIIKAYKLNDPKLLYIAKIIHDIEINVWNQKIMPETDHVKNAIQTIITSSKGNDYIIRESMMLFDALYNKVNNYIP
jgi:hypothetical protein